MAPFASIWDANINYMGRDRRPQT